MSISIPGLILIIIGSFWIGFAFCSLVCINGFTQPEDEARQDESHSATRYEDSPQVVTDVNETDFVNMKPAHLSERTKALDTAAYHLDEWGEYFDNIAGASDPVSAQGLRRKAGICREQAAHARAALDGKEPTK